MNMFVMEEPQIGLPGSHNPLHRILQESGVSHQVDPLTAGLLIGGSMLLGGIAGAVEGNARDRQQNEQTELTYQYDKKNWEHDWDGAKEQYKWKKEDVDNQRENNIDQVNLQNAQREQDWRHSLAIADFEHNQKNAAYNASVDTYEDQLKFNKQELALGIEAEDLRFKEAAVQSAYDQKQLLQTMFTTAGLADFEKASVELDLREDENTAGYGEQKVLQQHKDRSSSILSKRDQIVQKLEGETKAVKLEQQRLGLKGQMDQSEALFNREHSKNDFEDALNVNTQKSKFISQDLTAEQKKTSIAREGLGLDVFESDEQRKFSQKEAQLNLDKLRTKSANEAQEIALQTIAKKGQARLGQAGASNLATMQAITAALGRQTSALIDAANQQGGMEKLLNWQAQSKHEIAQMRAAHKSRDLDVSIWDKTLKAKIDVDKADADLGIAGKKAKLKEQQFDSQVTDIAKLSEMDIKGRGLSLDNLADMTDLEIEELAKEQQNADLTRNLELTNIGNILKNKQNVKDHKEEKINWKLVQEESKFDTNSDVIASMLDFAVKETAQRKKKLTAQKFQEDVLAEAKLMTRPVRGPVAQKPMEIPFTKFTDPLDPRDIGKPPKPVRGVKATGGGWRGFLSGATSGIGPGGAVVGALGG